MSPPLPRISIVTPSLNQAAFLERTIRSVLDQAYPNLEYIVMDGGSTDGSVEIIRKYADRLTHWVSQPDGGQSAAINAGWRRATGDVLAWLNSDDYYLAGALGWAGDFFAQHPGVWAAYGTSSVVDAEQTQLAVGGKPYRRTAMILSGNCIPQPTAFIRRDALNVVGALDESLHYLMDMDLFLRIARIRPPVFVDRRIAAMTSHAEAKTVRDRRNMARERALVRFRHARPLEKPIVALLAGVSRLMHSSPALTAAADEIRRRTRR
jgi:glycosyltransferase involved in cell wall biosynthesis